MLSRPMGGNRATQPRLRTEALERLLTGLVDYAGTFPPAGLAIEAACEGFARARSSSASWVAGRFAVALGDVPAVDAWLAEASDGEHGGRPWPLTVVIGAGWDRVAEMAGRSSERVALEAYEGRVASGAEVEAAHVALRRQVASSSDVVLEVPADREEVWPELLEAIASHGARAKLRTGSVRPTEIPTPRTVARFLAACAARDLPLKLTAGLHRALRAERALTYEPGGPCGQMHGFVNAYAAAGLALLRGAPVDTLERCLETREARAFEATASGLRIAFPGVDTTFTPEELRQLRTRVAAFGSCSFDEPLEDLVSLGWLDPNV